MEISIRTSDRTQFKRCRQLWDFTSNLRMNLEPIPTAPNALWFGSGIHAALAAYYAQSPRDIATALRVWFAYCDDAPFTIPDAVRDLGDGMLTHYGTWAQANDRFDVVHVETSQKAPLFKLTRDYGGYKAGTIVNYSYRLDGLLWYENHYFIHEIKTAASFDSTYDYLANDDQVGSYLEREQARLGIPIEGVIYTVLRKKVPIGLRVLKDGSFSKDRSQDTTYEIAVSDLQRAYNGVVPPDWKEFLTFLFNKPNNFVYREVVRRTPAEIQRIKLSIRDEIADMLGKPRIYRNPSKMNCNGCSFYTPCLTKWEGRDYRPLLAVNYKERDD